MKANIELTVVELVFLESILIETVKELKKRDDPALLEAMQRTLKKVRKAIKVCT